MIERSLAQSLVYGPAVNRRHEGALVFHHRWSALEETTKFKSFLGSPCRRRPCALNPGVIAQASATRRFVQPPQGCHPPVESPACCSHSQGRTWALCAENCCYKYSNLSLTCLPLNFRFGSFIGFRCVFRGVSMWNLLSAVWWLLITLIVTLIF